VLAPLALLLATALPTMLAGVLPLDGALEERWAAAGAWRMPVGAPELLGVPGAPDEPAFRVVRGIERSRHRVTHQGVDLVNGRSGDPVRAAASGIVAVAYDGDNGNGYGGHVVIAHRLEDGLVLYTVYAHLERGSVSVRAGDVACAGDPLGRVGSSGRASTPHLHFEVREPDRADDRWEKTAVIDPLAFVADHAGSPLLGVADDETPGTYLRWAAGEGLLAKPADAATALTRGQWWRMLARAVEGGRGHAGAGAEALRDSLIDDGVLPEEEAGAPAGEHLTWEELARDVKRLREIGLRVPHGPLPAADHEAACEARFGQRAPASHPGALRRREGEPTLADVSMLVADLSGPRPEPQVGRSGADTRAASASLRPGRKHAGAKHVKRRPAKHRTAKRRHH
jgi:hypothetical protein